MGASGWSHVVAHDPDPQAALTALRRQVLADGDHAWGPDEVEYLGPLPTDLDALDDFRDDEEFWEVGTHSVLDVDRVLPPGSPDEPGAVRVLADGEVVEMFGTSRPGRADFEVREPELPLPARWSGYCTTLYDAEGPAALAIWGSSGD